MRKTRWWEKQAKFWHGLFFGLPLGLLEFAFFVETMLYRDPFEPLSLTWQALPLLLYVAFAGVAGTLAAFWWKSAHAGTDLGSVTGAVAAISASLITLAFTFVYANTPLASYLHLDPPATTPNRMMVFFVIYFIPINFAGLILSMLAGAIGGMAGRLIARAISRIIKLRQHSELC
jgi:hypothetical protein